MAFWMQLWPSVDVYTVRMGPTPPRPRARTSPLVLTSRMTASPMRFATDPPLVKMPPLVAGKPTISPKPTQNGVFDVSRRMIATRHAGVQSGRQQFRKRAYGC